VDKYEKQMYLFIEFTLEDVTCTKLYDAYCNVL